MPPIDLFQNPLRARHKTTDGKYRPRVLVKQLHPRDRRRMRRHFLDLEPADRLLRFGTELPDEQIERYVAGIDFSRDIVFGVYNRVFRLVAVGHLAFAPRDAAKEAVTDKARVAEFGVSVSRSARGIGVGSKMFERAAIHCRNNDVDTLYMHCLSSNKTMMHIAKKAGMEIHREYGEADAYLKLLPADPSSVMQEALDEQFATLDYTFKANKRAALKWLERLTLHKPKKK
ncbi:RimJ/RimL family protein N-acetyltransferase [Duganella sp. 3397]|uniref:GNAT family N-acetyltransferase n=1 Tax=Duganella sp. 3397 TaxID=2817732 RepID=UPI00285C2C84|nr:GNAT family N-acetyltransferase [Duganella sp. 3397]MDR7048093.1 RimJ/RimL family protein N-acetyltransferase [Duganella sp. 3397]